MVDLIFIALAFFAITGAIAMIVYKNPMFSALGVLITMLSVAGMFALLNATFLFLVQIIVYAGAIMTLILFISKIIENGGKFLFKLLMVFLF